MKPPIVAGKCREVFAKDPMFAFSGVSFQAPTFQGCIDFKVNLCKYLGRYAAFVAICPPRYFLIQLVDQYFCRKSYC